MAEDIKQIRRALIDQGWRIESRKGGHDMAIPPDPAKRPVVLPGTPGGGRWRENLLASSAAPDSFGRRPRREGPGIG
jgi:hypothetical protein